MVKGMTVLVICMVHGMDYKHCFFKIVHTHIIALLCSSLAISTKCELNLIRKAELKELLDSGELETGARYMTGTRHSCQRKDVITIEHAYRIDVFNDVIGS
ncbi:unnamed protein product [Prunus brigantina]